MRMGPGVLLYCGHLCVNLFLFVSSMNMKDAIRVQQQGQKTTKTYEVRGGETYEVRGGESKEIFVVSHFHKNKLQYTY